jgi:hypothetical protein
MSKKPKKPRKEPAERVLIIDEWDKWVKGKIPEGEKGTDMQGLEFHGYLVERSHCCLNSSMRATGGSK